MVDEIAIIIELGWEESNTESNRRYSRTYGWVQLGGFEDNIFSYSRGRILIV